MAECDGRMVVGDTPSANAADWLRYAEQGHDAARFLADRACFSHACEGARHSVELALNAVLVDRGFEQPLHATSLLLLTREIDDDLPADLRSALVKLDHYGDYASYPSELIPRPSEYYEESEATEALLASRRLIDWAGRYLPEQVVAEARQRNAGPEAP